jgi:type IV pilus assembly protein PilB
MINPADINAMDHVAMVASMPVQPVMTTLANLFDTIQQVYGHKKAPPPQVSERREIPVPEPVKPQGGDTVTDLVNAMLQEGMALQASDIHLESGEKAVRIRFRVDGMLQDGKDLPKEIDIALVARIKLLAKLDITETRLPQDGHIRFAYAGHNVDVRVSTLPTVHGEKIVMRLLDSSKSLHKLKELGIDKDILRRFEDAITVPNGLILVTGPTGSGKTTTLYAALSELNKSDRNIVTLEDPVEYIIERINQMETFPKIGLTFAAGLRAILRQDPNIILVGEIRDLETAEIALQASITGHLVFSTLHTNDAVASIHRLFNMRVEPFMIAAALRGVLSQRLMRRLCDKCKRPQKFTDEQRREFNISGAQNYYEPVGCPACFNTGYSGRFAIHEWLAVSGTIRGLIVNKASVDELRKAAVAEGFKSIRQTAMDKAVIGDTSLEEVFRLTREQVDA